MEVVALDLGKIKPFSWIEMLLELLLLLCDLLTGGATLFILDLGEVGTRRDAGKASWSS